MAFEAIELPGTLEVAARQGKRQKKKRENDEKITPCFAFAFAFFFAYLASLRAEKERVQVGWIYICIALLTRGKLYRWTRTLLLKF